MYHLAEAFDSVLRTQSWDAPERLFFRGGSNLLSVSNNFMGRVGKISVTGSGVPSGGYMYFGLEVTSQCNSVCLPVSLSAREWTISAD